MYCIVFCTSLQHQKKLTTFERYRNYTYINTSTYISYKITTERVLNFPDEYKEKITH